MDIKLFFENTKKRMISLGKNVIDFSINNTKIVISIITLLILVLILVLFISISSNKNKKEIVSDNNLILTENMLIPDGPEVQTNYKNSRTTEDKWSQEEADKWFTIPSQKDLDNLNKTNEKIISDITGAAPWK